MANADSSKTSNQKKKKNTIRTKRQPITPKEILDWKVATTDSERQALWEEICSNDRMEITDALALIALDACVNGVRTNRPCKSLVGETITLPPAWARTESWKKFARALYDQFRFPEYAEVEAKEGVHAAKKQWASHWIRNYRDMIDPYFRTGRLGYYQRRDQGDLASPNCRPILRWGLLAPKKLVSEMTAKLLGGKIQLEFTPHNLRPPKEDEGSMPEEGGEEEARDEALAGVYIIGHERLGWKIGYSADVDQRKKELQTAAGDELEIHHVIEIEGNIRQAEAYFHHQYRHRHKYGEWYHLTETELKFLRSISGQRFNLNTQKRKNW